MSKADISCGRCGNDFKYSGLSKTSAFCPRCSLKIYIRAPAKNSRGSMVDVISHFGIPDESS